MGWKVGGKTFIHSVTVVVVSDRRLGKLSRSIYQGQDFPSDSRKASHCSLLQKFVENNVITNQKQTFLVKNLLSDGYQVMECCGGYYLFNP